jgi:hypothetical protein
LFGLTLERPGPMNSPGLEYGPCGERGPTWPSGAERLTPSRVASSLKREGWERGKLKAWMVGRARRRDKAVDAFMAKGCNDGVPSR